MKDMDDYDYISKQHRMNAIVYDTYGTTEVLRMEQIAVPVPQDYEVLIEVYASSVNSWDWDLLRGKPFINRIGAVRKPRYRTLGADVAGRVASTGSLVTRFKPGDEVFGDLSGCSWGAFADYVCASERALTLKPDGISHVQAAAIPQAAVLALQGLRNHGKLHRGQHVLINGAGGGVGTFGIQYAKLLGAEVTAVDRADKLHMLQTVGTDHVLDYREVDFTAIGTTYDVILDVIGNHSVTALKHALVKGGRYVMIGGPMPRILMNLLYSPFISTLEQKKLSVLVHKPNHEDQLFWIEQVKEGRVVPVIHHEYALHDIAKAIQDLAEGKVKGKAVVSIRKPTAGSAYI
ncbi:NAD(P)-dependent alcohol dehydrogenase [Paenibacillus polysaccharolyticus]|uniref:NAD(P)-dependent alcohol dehydrogenase n=1 Tax=Paenibacillus polysaccharolyticus TaxID=582692 RepID=UPI00209D9D4A|nr:NAD(P)-dependent alcohol dehydrogenase [Paenibacillus polysaccharolyticus]MCP1133970.1 NAD(P)-dependent alcohol dehydrogenase [Paenibacillus polysaccharolyticus]